KGKRLHDLNRVQWLCRNPQLRLQNPHSSNMHWRDPCRTWYFRAEDGSLYQNPEAPAPYSQHKYVPVHDGHMLLRSEDQAQSREYNHQWPDYNRLTGHSYLPGAHTIWDYLVRV